MGSFKILFSAFFFSTAEGLWGNIKTPCSHSTFFLVAKHLAKLGKKYFRSKGRETCSHGLEIQHRVVDHNCLPPFLSLPYLLPPPSPFPNLHVCICPPDRKPLQDPSAGVKAARLPAFDSSVQKAALSSPRSLLFEWSALSHKTKRVEPEQPDDVPGQKRLLPLLSAALAKGRAVPGFPYSKLNPPATFVSPWEELLYCPF